MKNIWFIFFLLLGIQATGQVVYDFEKHSITDWEQSPSNRWEISDISPISDSASLHHTYDNADSDRDRISFSYERSLTGNPTTWRFQVRYDYNPSGGNNWGVFLVSDTTASEMHPSGAVNGYLAGVNYGDSDDLLKIWEVTSGGGSEFITTSFNWQENIDPGTDIGLEVQYDGEGNWNFLIDTSGGYNNLVSIGEGTNSKYTETKHTGIFYEYTSSADQKLWIDDFYIGSPLSDTTAPVIQKAQIISSTEISIHFSEATDTSVALQTDNYTIDNQRNPSSVSVTDTLNREVKLTFSEAFRDSTGYQLQITNIPDTSNNTLTDTTVALFYDRLKVSSLQVKSLNTLKVQFNKSTDTLTSKDTSNYTLNPGARHPENIEKHPENEQAFLLHFSKAFKENTEYTLSAKDIIDLKGDTLKPSDHNFKLFYAETNDVVINEIMADPYPTVGLPDNEYLELYNTTSSEINLTNWTLEVGSSNQNLPEVSISPESYLLLCDEDATALINNYPNVLGLASLPNLTNSGAEIIIKDTSGGIINQVSYNDQWYQDETKEDGGYSLEKIDPENNCSGMNNWKASEASEGGTPGTENAVFASNMDTIAPTITSFDVQNNQKIIISFSEMVDTSSLELTDFTISPGIGSPSSIQLNSPYYTKITLHYTDSLKQDTKYNIVIKGISDRCGNEVQFTDNFIYHREQPNEIQINEIMADPSPVVNLPEFEYIELYNASQYDISLNNWSLFVDGTKRTIPNATLEANGYLILCDKESQAAFDTYGNTYAFESLPAISQSGASLVLENDRQKIISFIEFDDSWYPNEYKKDGGWSLEQIDPGNPCGEGNNWSASENSNGGTPGTKNSIYGNNPDSNSPILLRASYEDTASVKLHFNETVKKSSFYGTEKYNIETLGTPFRVIPVSPAYKSVILRYSTRFKKGIRYEIKVTDTIMDCAGNVKTETQTVEFEIPQKIKEGDLVINEILFNPKAGGHDFIEIYNNTTKTFKAADLCVGSGNDYKDVTCLLDYEYLLFPKTHIVFTESASSTARDYYVENPQQIIEIEDLPSYRNTEGTAFLMNRNSVIIDKMDYNEEMHFPMLRSTQGVSLERIHYERPSDQKSSWHSAAESAGFGTPTYKNSQYSETLDPDMNFTVEPEVFSPDNDGRDDLLNIHYKFDQPGHVANIKIFDARGRLEKQLVNNQTLGTEGTFTWDGINKNNQKASLGVYIIYIEVFDLNGNINKIKKHCVVGGKL
jgi:hypothetical protein